MNVSVHFHETFLMPAILITFLMLPLSLYGTRCAAATSLQGRTASPHNQRFMRVNKSFKDGIAQITTSNLTIRITGKNYVPHFHFWSTAHPATKYHAKFMYLAEYRDKNGDDAFQHDELVHKGSYGAKLFQFTQTFASWNFSDFYNITKGVQTTGIGFNFTMVSQTIASPFQNKINITIMNRFFFQDATTTLKGASQEASFNVSGLAALKTNIWVSNWQFEDSDNQLALRWDISQDGQPTQARFGGKSVDFGKQMAQGNEQPLPPQKNKQATLAFKSSNSTTTYLAVSTIVKAGPFLESSHLSYRTDGSNLRFFMSAPATDGTIIYDPIFGTSSTSFPSNDSTAPVLTITAPAETTLLNTRTVTIAWRGSDTGSGIASYAIKLNDGDWISVGTDTSYTFTDLSEGEHVVAIKAVDNAGNPTVKTFTFTITFIDVTQLAIPSIITAALFIVTITTSVFYVLKRNGAF